MTPRIIAPGIAYIDPGESYDQAYADKLVVALGQALGRAVIDGDVVRFKLGEMTDALVNCLIHTAAMSEASDDELIEFAERIKQQIITDVPVVRAGQKFRDLFVAVEDPEGNA